MVFGPYTRNISLDALFDNHSSTLSEVRRKETALNLSLKKTTMYVSVSDFEIWRAMTTCHFSSFLTKKTG